MSLAFVVALGGVCGVVMAHEQEAAQRDEFDIRCRFGWCTRIVMREDKLGIHCHRGWCTRVVLIANKREIMERDELGIFHCCG